MTAGAFAGVWLAAVWLGVGASLYAWASGREPRRHSWVVVLAAVALWPVLLAWSAIESAGRRKKAREK